MSLKDNIYKLSVADLGLHPNTANRLVERARTLPRPDREDLVGLRHRVTVSEVVETFGDYRGGYHASSTERAFMQKLVELGLTRLDWICLPQKSVTVEALKACPQDELLAKPALVLGDPSPQMLNCIADYIHPDEWSEHGRADKVTVGELLKLEAAKGRQRELEQELRSKYRAGVLKTRKFIEEIGINLPFRLERFMYFWTREDLRSQLMEKYTMSYGRADHVIEIAAKEGWIPQFLE